MGPIEDRSGSIDGPGFINNTNDYKANIAVGNDFDPDWDMKFGIVCGNCLHVAFLLTKADHHMSPGYEWDLIRAVDFDGIMVDKCPFCKAIMDLEFIREHPEVVAITLPSPANAIENTVIRITEDDLRLGDAAGIEKCMEYPQHSCAEWIRMESSHPPHDDVWKAVG